MSKKNVQLPNWFKPNQICHLELGLYSQLVIAVNLYEFNTENDVYECIKHYFSTTLNYNQTQLDAVFTDEQERYIKGNIRSGFDEYNCGYVFRFCEIDSIICIFVNPVIQNEHLLQRIIYQYLVHEVTHCALRVLDHCGVKMPRTLDEYEDENICLLIDYIFINIAHIFEIEKFMKPIKQTKSRKHA